MRGVSSCYPASPSNPIRKTGDARALSLRIHGRTVAAVRHLVADLACHRFSAAVHPRWCSPWAGRLAPQCFVSDVFVPGPAATYSFGSRTLGHLGEVFACVRQGRHECLPFAVHDRGAAADAQGEQRLARNDWERRGDRAVPGRRKLVRLGPPPRLGDAYSRMSTRTCDTTLSTISLPFPA